mmetsp:Transcript_9075/g.32159  ORF Transcript_9075/g.32159 Transcript_9075/m.32159 type:complete len:491 (-) Transcript_9075:14-1486(-)
MPCLVGREKGVGRAGGAGTTGAAHSVDVVLDRAWKVVVDHILDVLHIKTSRCHIGRNQDRTLTLLELLEHPVALLLFLVAVDAQCGPTIQAHLTRELVAIALRGAEDQDLGAVHDLLQQALESAALVLLLHDLDVLSDGVRGTHLQSADVDVHWVLLADIAGQTLHLLGPRGTPHERLPVGPALAGDLAHLRLETHVQHAVSLVEGQVRNTLEVEVAGIEEVDQTAWRRNHNLHTVLQILLLGPSRHATIAAGVLNLGALAEAVALFLDLHRQLTGGRHDQHDRTIALGEVGLRIDVDNCRQQERQGLSGACLCNAHHVTAGERNRPTLNLNGRGLFETSSLHFLQDVLWERGFFEGPHRFRDAGARDDGDALGLPKAFGILQRHRGDGGVLLVEILLELDQALPAPLDIFQIGTQVLAVVVALGRVPVVTAIRVAATTTTVPVAVVAPVVTAVTAIAAAAAAAAIAHGFLQGKAHTCPCALTAGRLIGQ